MYVHRQVFKCLLLLLLLSFWGCKQEEEQPAKAPKQAAPSQRPTAPEDVRIAQADQVQQVSFVVEPSLSEQQSEQSFRLALNGPPKTLEPQRVTDIRSAFLAINSFEGLMTFDSETGPVVNGLAESYEVSEEGRRYTFQLREGLHWSNGDPLVAEDFVYSWRRALDPERPSPYAWLLAESARLQGAREYLKGKVGGEGLGVQALDTRTLVVDLEEASPHFIELTAMPVFAPLHRGSIEAHPDDWIRPPNMVCSGAFKLVAQPDKDTLIYHKNQQYWQADKVWLERIEVHLLEGDKARLAAFDAGEIDWTGPEHLTLNPKERRSHRDTLHADPYLAVEFLVFNTQKAPLSRREVRQAINLAVDREEIVAQALDGVGHPAWGLVPAMPGFRSQVTVKGDLAEAHSLLAKGGFASGEVFPPLEYLYPQENRAAARVAEVVKRQLEEGLGLKVNLRAVPQGELLKALNEGQFTMARAAWIADYVDPAAFLEQWRSGSGQNYARWESEQFDTLLDRAMNEGERARRPWLLQQAELELARELPLIPLFHAEQVHLLRPPFWWHRTPCALLSSAQLSLPQ